MKSSLNVAIRVDASQVMGTGHVMRCLTLADALRSRGGRVHFICRAHPGHLADRIVARGHRVTLLPPGQSRFDADGTAHAAWLGASRVEDAEQTRAALDAAGDDGCDALIVDHYAIDRRWEALLRPHCRRLMLIDDLADRPHDCDALLDQNIFDDAERRYDGLLPEGARRFIGPSFALLRDEIRESRNIARPPAPPWNVLAFFGGTDPAGMLVRALEAATTLTDLPMRMQLVGPRPTHLAHLPGNVEWFEQVDDFGAMMARSHLALGAAGSATLERLYLGLPALVVVCADNQRVAAGCLEKLGVARVLGESTDIGPQEIAVAVRRQLQARDDIERMAELTGHLQIGGQTSRIFDFLEEHDAATTA